MEYFKDGTSKVFFYESFDCNSQKYISNQLWIIYNAYQYYTESNEETWYEDKIIEIKDDSYIMQSDELLYRIKGDLCKESLKNTK